jgi:uncharacterized protein (TIGR03437 family)
MRSIRTTDMLQHKLGASRKLHLRHSGILVASIVLLLLCLTFLPGVRARFSEHQGSLLGPQQTTSSWKSGASAVPATGASEDRLIDRFGRLPLYFVENVGQTDRSVRYYIPGSDKSVFFTDRAVTTSLLRRDTTDRWSVKLDFVDANPESHPEGLNEASARVSYFSGTPSHWKRGARTYNAIIYRELWPGIDLVYSGTSDRLKYTFHLKPGADPQRIRLAYRGADLKLLRSGELEVSTPVASFHDEAPSSFQNVSGNESAIATRFQLLDDGSTSRQTYGFALGEYDRGRELVIDPAVLLFCGFIGGQGDDVANAIAVDSVGSSYIVGRTSSPQASFPVVAGPDLLYNGGQNDAFVAKLNPAGNALVYIGYIGGVGSDEATGVAIDATGSAYVIGNTFSDQTSFPVLVGPRLTYARNGDSFVAKVNVAGTALEYCGYVGGDGRDFGNGIAVDASKAAYIVGATDSNELSFPVSIGPRLSYSGEIDAYVAKINPTGTGFVYCGYVGGNRDDFGRDVAVNVAGEAFIAGDTESTQLTFPVVVGPDLTYNGGDRDGFVSKISATGAGILFSGYVGGVGSDSILSLAVDSSNSVYLTGQTNSDQTTFPVLSGPDLTFNGSTDAFVSKLNAAGTAFVYSGYIGGSGNESGLSIDIDSAGNAYIGGETSSFQSTFPVVGGPQLHANGVLDGFVAKLNTAGNSLVYCGYLGGNANERVNGIAVSSTGIAYVAGYTESTQTTFPVVFGPDLTFNGGATDAFVAKIERQPDVTPPGVASVGAVNRTRGSSGAATLAFVSDEDTRPGNIFVALKNVPGTISVSDLTNNNGTVSATFTVPCNAPTGAFVMSVEATDGAGLKSTADVTLNVTGNTPPVLSAYPASQILAVGGGAIISPASAPTDNGTIETMTASALGFTGQFSVNKSTGVITVQNAGPRDNFVVVVVATDNCQEGSVTTFQLSVGQPNPVPAITAVTPPLIAVGTPGAVLTITGSNFVTDSKVLWNNSARTTTFVSAQELKLTVTTQDLAALSTNNVTVSNSVPGGGVSNAVTVSVVNTVGTTNAASFAGSIVAPDSIVAIFGIDLATGTASAEAIPLPTNLLGTTVTIKDSTGTERTGGLFFVSPGQINMAMPAATATGRANITVRNGQGVSSVGTVDVELVAPGIFTASSNGSGAPAAQVLRINAQGIRTLEPVARFDVPMQKWVPIPIDLGPESDQLFLILFGTGIRLGSGTQGVVVTIGGIVVDTQFAGAVPGFVALDQINAVLKRSLAGKGEVNAVVKVDNSSSNTFILAFR